MNLKKPISLLFIMASACIIDGCHSGTNPSNSIGSVHTADTAKTHTVTPQPIDTTIKDGKVTKHYASGLVKEKSYYAAGRRQGECQSFYPNGKLWSDDYFSAGLIDGKTTVYYNNGQKEYEGTCTKGKPSGLWKFYDEKGKLVRSKNYGDITNPSM